VESGIAVEQMAPRTHDQLVMDADNADLAGLMGI